MADPRPARWFDHASFTQRRRAAGLRQVDVAAVLGVTQTAVSRWERGRRQPTRYQGAVLAKLLGCRPADLDGTETVGTVAWSEWAE